MMRMGTSRSGKRSGADVAAGAVTRRAWILFTSLCLVWGIPYLLIRVAAREVSPPLLAATRCALGAAVLLPLAARRGELRSLRHHGRWLAGFAVIEISIPFVLIGYGEQHLTSSLTGLLIASVPLFVAVLALRLDASQRVTGPRLAGLGVGLLGVLLLLGLDVGGDGEALLAAGAVLLAAVSYAGGALIIGRAAAQGVPTLGLAAGGLAGAALLLAVPAVVTLPPAVPSGRVLLSLGVLGIVCTALALVLLTALIGEAGASRATVITYVNPAVAVALGVALLDEPVSWATGAGFALILAGSWLSTTGGAPRRRPTHRRVRTDEPAVVSR